MKRTVSLFLISLVFAGFVFAETITLKSGEQVQGNVIEKTSDYIKVESDGMHLIYFLDEIQNIEEGTTSRPSSPYTKEEKPHRTYSQIKFDMQGPPPAILGFLPLFFLVIGIILIAALWKVFSKAGQPGWASIIPIYNLYILLKVADRPGWWLLLFFIPLVSIIIAIIINIDVAKKFGKGVGFGLGLAFLSFIFLPMLAFGDAQYTG